MQIQDLKKRSGAQAFASIFGKSSIPEDSLAYRTIESAVEILITNGYGIIHGGYAGGAMSAASDTANRLIEERGLPKELNIAVPQKQHDELWERVLDASFVEEAADIFTRLKVITSSDIAVIAPLGGIGTEVEENIVFHENMVRDSLAQHGKETEKPISLIFLECAGGTEWRKLISTKLELLAVPSKKLEDYPWLHFVESLEEFESLVKQLKQ